MKRRRLIVVATVAGLALGAAWWLLDDRLSAEERRLVGAWRTRNPPPGTTDLIVFHPDRRCFSGPPNLRDPSALPCHWYLRNGLLVIDHEPSGLRRAVRPVFIRFGLDFNGWNDCLVEW